jgi:hypothetical protein
MVGGDNMEDNATMSREEICQAMIDWQIVAGEDFLDYFDGDVNISNLMCWARGKGYLTIEQFNQWEQDDSFESLWLTCVVHDCGGYDKPYSFVREEEWTEEGQEKAYTLLAEFISESITYQERFQRFLRDN